MPTTASTWLTALQEQALGHRLPHIDLLLDATGLRYPLWQSLAELKTAPGMALLLDGTPEQSLARQGPVLLRLQWAEQEHQRWLQQLLDGLHQDSRLLALRSAWPFAELASHLRHCTQAEWNQGRSGGLLRYWDPRLFLAVSDTLTPQQSHWFHAPAIAWHWLDRDGQPRQLPGQPTRSGELPQPLPTLALSNEQVAELVAWTCAESFRLEWCIQPHDHGLIGQEQLIRHLVHAQLAADRERLHDLEQREAFMHRWLADRRGQGALG